MPADNKVAAPEDAVDKFLTDEKSFEDRRKSLIDALLKQKEAAMKDFDDKLEKLGYAANGAKSRRNHHRKGASAPAEGKAKP